MEGGPELEQRGIIPNTLVYLFDKTEKASAVSNGTREYVVYASYMEIYNENIRDLLSKDPKAHLDLKESKEKGVFVNGLSTLPVSSAQEITRKLLIGKRNRAVASHNLNQESSRSHAILTLTVVCIDKLKKGSPAKNGKDSQRLSVGKLNLVDLAGSERSSKTGATGNVLKEGININMSLLSLGNVISALADGKKGVVIPYRDSKLTRVLQDSLGGNTKTVMIANIGPADWNVEETLSTLRYANRAKSIKNAPKQNNNPQDAVVKEYQEEISKLHASFAAQISAMEQQHKEELEELKRELEQKAEESKTRSVSPVEAQEVEELRAKLVALQDEQDERARLEMQASFLRQQLREMQEEVLKAEQKHVKTAAELAAQRQQHEAQAEAKRKMDERKSQALEQKSLEMESLREQLASVQAETVSDYRKMVEQQDELARIRARMLATAGQQISENDAELAAMHAQLAALKESGGKSDLQEAEINRLKDLVETLQARAARPKTARIGLTVSVTEGSSPGRSLRADQGFNQLFETLVVEMGFDPDASRQAILALPCGTMDQIIDYVTDREDLFTAWRHLKTSMQG